MSIITAMKFVFVGGYYINGRGNQSIDVSAMQIRTNL